jgi:hypothetical protein
VARARGAPNIPVTMSDWKEKAMMSRRLALRVLLAGSAALAASAYPSASRAFRIVDAEETSPAVQSLIGACETRNAHERLVAELLAELEGEQGPAAAAEALRGMACPLCGCGLGPALPDLGAAPRF